MFKIFGRSSELVTSVLRHDLARLERLLTDGADPNEPDEEGWRPLHAAVGQVDVEACVDCVRLLLKHGADVNLWDFNVNETPLLGACDPPNIAIATMLLDAGADPNVRRSDGESPLRLSAASQDLEMAKLLLHYGAGRTINEYGGILGLTALAIAAGNFDVPMIELLLQHGANPETLEEFGETARDKLPAREEHDPGTWDRVVEMLGRRKS